VQFSAASWQKPEITLSHSNVAEHPSLLSRESELLDKQFDKLQTIAVLQYREKGEFCLDCLTLIKKTQQSLMSETTWLKT
jgi:hypothetical protein